MISAAELFPEARDSHFSPHAPCVAAGGGSYGSSSTNTGHHRRRALLQTTDGSYGSSGYGSSGGTYGGTSSSGGASGARRLTQQTAAARVQVLESGEPLLVYQFEDHQQQPQQVAPTGVEDHGELLTDEPRGPSDQEDDSSALTQQLPAGHCYCR